MPVLKKISSLVGRVGSGVSVSAEFYYYLCGLVPVFKKKILRLVGRLWSGVWLNVGLQKNSPPQISTLTAGEMPQVGKYFRSGNASGREGNCPGGGSVRRNKSEGKCPGKIFYTRC